MGGGLRGKMRSDESVEQKSINNLESMIVRSDGVRVAARVLAVETLITWNQVWDLQRLGFIILSVFIVNRSFRGKSSEAGAAKLDFSLCELISPNLPGIALLNSDNTQQGAVILRHTRAHSITVEGGAVKSLLFAGLFSSSFLLYSSKIKQS